MNWNVIEGNWKQVAGGLKEKWGDLTGDDIDRLDGSREQLAGLLQEKFGWAEVEAERQIDEWAASLKEQVSK